jgi:hypothetical protein
MNAPIDLKDLERKAWTSFFQDGLMDIYLGLLLFILALVSTVLQGMSSAWLRYTIYFALIGAAFLAFWAGRRYITIPRLGRVKFGPERRRKRTRLAVVMSMFVLLNVLLIFLTVAAKNNPHTWGRFMPSELALNLFIGVYVGAAMAIIAYYKDFQRGYYIALVFALTFAGVEFLDNPAVFWIGGGLVFIPGLVLLVRFLRQHPIPPSEVMHDQPGS